MQSGFKIGYQKTKTTKRIRLASAFFIIYANLSKFLRKSDKERTSEICLSFIL